MDRESILDTIYEASVNDEKFFDLMDVCSQKFDTPSVIYILQNSSISPGISIKTNISYKDWTKYEAYYSKLDPCVGQESNAPVDRVFSNIEFFGENDPEKNEHVNDYLRPIFGGRLVQAIVLDRCYDRVSLLATGIRESMENSHRKETESFLEYIRPHLQRVSKLRRKRGENNADYNTPYGQLNLPVVRYYISGELLYTNRIFDRDHKLLGNIFCIEKQTRGIRLNSDSDLIRASRELHSQGEKTLTFYSYGNHGGVVRVTIISMRKDECVAIFEFARRGSTEIDPDFGIFFGLTAAEIALCQIIADGTRVFEAASILGRAKSTVRNQLMSIFAKTGTASQPELVSLLRLAERRSSLY
ncbi:MAG: hypothetical protein AcusKO_33720 [Acuticoccus sp.]